MSSRICHIGWEEHAMDSGQCTFTEGTKDNGILTAAANTLIEQANSKAYGDSKQRLQIHRNEGFGF